MVPSQPNRHCLSLESVGYRVEARAILTGVSAAITTGELVAVVGPNGAGKSTLLHLMAGLLHPTEGAVTLDGQDLAQMPRKAVARQVAMLPQQVRADFGFIARDVVRMGRYPYLGRWRPPSPVDEAVVQHAVDATATAPLVERLVTELSGGERQLIFLAQALAQEPRFLLLDEPTANLDVAHQCHILRLLHGLAGQGVGVVAVIHDLGLALRGFQRLLLVHEGRLVADGAPLEVLSVETIQRVFRVQARIHQDDASATPVLWFPL
jgi:iron complex transport system ATP-binding protein